MQSIIQKKQLIFSLLFFIISCFIFWFLYKNININKERAQLAEEKWHEEQTKKDSIKSVVTFLNTIESDRMSLENHFVKSSDVVPFLNMIEVVGNRAETKTEVISVDVSKENVSLVVDIKASGSFESIYKLIALLENSPYNLEFISANIKKNTIGELLQDKNKWTATFKIKLLSFIN